MSDIFALFVLVIVLMAVLSVLLSQVITGVPPMPISSSEAADIISLLRQGGLPSKGIVYELGCGWGTLVIALARAFPNAQIRGIELSPLPYWIARIRTRHMPNVFLQRGNFYNSDIRDADAVTCYLMISPMPRLANFLDRMLRAGTPVVSLTFWFRNREVSASRNGPGLRGEAALYYWPAHSS